MSDKVSRSAVDDFVSQKTLAVVGVSRDGKKFGARVYHDLKEKGYRVFAVNPNIDAVGGDLCYPALQAIPERADGVVIVVPPGQTEQVVRDAERAGIARVWMQQGAESEAAVRFCRENGMSVVHGYCIMMFARPFGFHKFHRRILSLFGRLPK